MSKSLFLAGLFLTGFTISAQVNGVVTDSISGLPVPYARIWAERENQFTTSEENGRFSIDVPSSSKKLVFSAMGYARKAVAIDQADAVRLNPVALALDEVVISSRRQTRQKEIGRGENQIFEAFDHAPKIDIKFFPYLRQYQKTKFIKQVGLITDSKIDEASFKIHFYRVGADGLPGEEMLGKDLIVSVGKGLTKTKFNVSELNLRMPEEGIFVGFEKLLIARNKSEKTVTDPVTKKQQILITHQPMLLYDSIKRDFQIVFSDGQWRKSNPSAGGSSDKIRIYEPAITLILTN